MSKSEKLKVEIKNLKKQITTTRANMTKQKAQNAPKHYQESGKRKIENLKKLLNQKQDELKRINGGNISQRKSKKSGGALNFIFKILKMLLKS